MHSPFYPSLGSPLSPPSSPTGYVLTPPSSPTGYVLTPPSSPALFSLGSPFSPPPGSPPESPLTIFNNERHISGATDQYYKNVKERDKRIRSVDPDYRRSTHSGIEPSNKPYNKKRSLDVHTKITFLEFFKNSDIELKGNNAFLYITGHSSFPNKLENVELSVKIRENTKIMSLTDPGCVFSSDMQDQTATFDLLSETLLRVNEATDQDVKIQYLNQQFQSLLSKCISRVKSVGGLNQCSAVELHDIPEDYANKTISYNNVDKRLRGAYLFLLLDNKFWIINIASEQILDYIVDHQQSGEKNVMIEIQERLQNEQVPTVRVKNSLFSYQGNYGLEEESLYTNITVLEYIKLANYLIEYLYTGERIPPLYEIDSSCSSRIYLEKDNPALFNRKLGGRKKSNKKSKRRRRTKRRRMRTRKTHHIHYSSV